MTKTEQYIIRMEIDSDKNDAICNTNLIVSTKQWARLMIQESNFTTIHRVIEKPDTTSKDDNDSSRHCGDCNHHLELEHDRADCDCDCHLSLKENCK